MIPHHVSLAHNYAVWLPIFFGYFAPGFYLAFRFRFDCGTTEKFVG
jgi:hypothetical protein